MDPLPLNSDIIYGCSLVCHITHLSKRFLGGKLHSALHRPDFITLMVFILANNMVYERLRETRFYYAK